MTSWDLLLEHAGDTGEHPVSPDNDFYPHKTIDQMSSRPKVLCGSSQACPRA